MILKLILSGQTLVKLGVRFTRRCMARNPREKDSLGNGRFRSEVPTCPPAESLVCERVFAYLLALFERSKSAFFSLGLR